MARPRNWPKWAPALNPAELDGTTPLGQDLRSGREQLSPAALAQLAKMYPDRSGLSEQERQRQLAELDAAEAELHRQHREIQTRRTALRGPESPKE